MSEADDLADELAAAVLSTLLREDYGGLSRHVRATPAGPVLDLPGPRGLALPLRADGFLTDVAVARPGPRLSLDDVASALAVVADPADADGLASFGAECRAALAALRLRRRHLPAARDALAAADAGGWLGPAGLVRYDALAAALPHPAYPTAAARTGMADTDALRYAPEYGPEFELAWVAVPRAAVRSAGRCGARCAGTGRPAWWPDPAAVGLDRRAGYQLFPVHPLTARTALASLLAPELAATPALGPAPASQLGLAQAPVLAPGRWLRVRPTLSVRTVAVTADPGVHLKLPLPVSTLGLRNHRLLAPGTLADGALVHRLLARLTARDPDLAGLLLADDGDFAHAGHPALGYLLRRLPDGLGRCRIAPVAALLAPAPAGGLVLDELASADGSGPVAFFGRYLELLFRIQLRLFVRYGIALESHQQNTAVAAGPGGLRLMVKDFDGSLIQPVRLTAALGPAAPDPAEFADPRLLTCSDDALADVFITITVHLCAAAVAFGLAERGYATRDELLGLVWRALDGALARYGDEPAARALRDRVLADRLPGKAMVTAGTLTDKARTGARDINKHYGPPGPNYLRSVLR